MKKLFAFSLMATLLIAATVLPTKESHSQITRQLTIAAADDTLVNADTATVSLTLDGSFKSVEGWLKEVSGTTGGTIYFQGEALHGGVWVDIDSLALSDVTTEQYKVFSVPNPRTYKAYRIRFIKTGTGTAEIKAFTLRYTGG